MSKPTKVVFEIKNLGRSKWSGEVTAQADTVEHIEAALMRAAEAHLMSRDIDFAGDDHEGKITVGGFRVVGEYKRKETPRVSKQ